MKNVEPLIVKTMLQSKPKSDISFPGRYFPEKVLLKNMIVDTTLKLTQKDWIKEQVDDVDLNKIIQLLKSNQLNTYMTQEMDSPAIQILLRCKKRSYSEERVIILENKLEKSSRTSGTVCTAKRVHL